MIFFLSLSKVVQIKIVFAPNMLFLSKLKDNLDDPIHTLVEDETIGVYSVIMLEEISSKNYWTIRSSIKFASSNFRKIVKIRETLFTI